MKKQTTIRIACRVALWSALGASTNVQAQGWQPPDWKSRQARPSIGNR